MDEWTWDPDDFAALWYSDANDRFPNPLHYRSRFALRDEFAAHRLVVRKRYSWNEMERIQLALDTLTTSDLRIEILGGTTKHKGRDGSLRMYRIVGARTKHQAVSLYQTANVEQDKPIRLRLFNPDDLPAHLAKSIPAREAGQNKPAMFDVRDLRPDNGSHLEDVSRASPRERYERLVHRPADGGGSAGLLTGPVNVVSQPLFGLQWHDLTDDGRYLERRSGDQVTVSPASVEVLSTQFATWIERALQRLQEGTRARW
jgi:hypothetical protein